MKKPLYKNFFFLAFIIFCFAVGVLYVFIHRTRVSIAPSISSDDVSSMVPEQSIENKNEGYSLDIPQTWYAEKNTTDTIAIYPDYSLSASSSPICKIEMSVFPYTSSTDVSDWISARLGADPTLDIHERSSGDVSVGDASGIEWTGTIDDVPTKLIYAFTDSHAYEIAPSVVTGTSTDAGQCDDALDIFLNKLNIQ